MNNVDEREKIKQELLEELKKEYQLVPIKEAKFTVSDILNKYYDDICIKNNLHREWQTENQIGTAIRKCIALHFGINNLTSVRADLREDVRAETERFIKEYILGGK